MIPFTCTVETVATNGQSSKSRKEKIYVEHIKTFKQFLNHLELIQVSSDLSSLA